MFGIGQQVLCM
jgi:hypothetical protein